MDGNNGSNDSGDSGNSYEGDYEGSSGNESNGDQVSSDSQNQGNDWNTTFDIFHDGTVEHAEVTASRGSQSDSAFSTFDSMSPSGNEGNISSSNESNDINIPASLLDNENINQTMSLLDAFSTTAETTIGIIEDAHEVAKVNMPKGLENAIKNADKALGAYNIASYSYSYGKAMMKGDHRTAASTSINSLIGIGVGAGLSFLPMGILLSVPAYALIEHYDVGGQIYDELNSLDIGVGIYDLIHDENQ